jgi:hypothetical protein
MMEKVKAEDGVNKKAPNIIRKGFDSQGLLNITHEK